MKNRYLFTGKGTLARQRGAIGILGALVLAMGVLFTALSVDSGRLYLEQRRLQKIADMAALDASRALCRAAAGDVGDVIDAAWAERNGYGGDLAVEVGTTDSVGGLRRFESFKSTTMLESSESPTAVQVTARNTVPSSLVAGGWLGGTTTLSATAVAGDDAIAGFSAGSFVLRWYPPLMKALLGTDLNVDLVSYKGLAAASVSLRGLIEAHGSLGTVNELLALNMDIADFLTLTAEALSNQGDAAAAATLNSIAASVTSPNALTLGDLLKVTAEDPKSALDAKVNVMDLLMGSAQVANGIHAVDIAVAIPGVTKVTLWLIELPQIAIGPAGKDADGNWKTQVKTAQMRLGVTVKLPLPNINVGLASITFDALGLVVELAQTTAALERINCPRYTAPVGRATVWVQPGIVGLALGKLDAAGNVTGPSHVATVKLKVLFIQVLAADIGAGADIDVESPGESLDFNGPFPERITVGTPLGPALAGALDDLAKDLTLTVTVLGVPLGALLNPVLSAISGALGPVITALGNTLLTPLLSALGITLGGADVQVLTLDGEQPRLRI